MTIDDLTNDEKSLLLYFEAMAVDANGRVNSEKMNDIDRKNAAKWNETGFVESGRIVSEYIHSRLGNLWCRLSDEAFALAAELRKARAKRLWENKNYQTTAEKQAQA